MGSLESLRELNVRRNQLTSLPEELSELPLVRLDISCNRISHIPVCYRHLRHLQTIILDNNPLQYPPAQICLKGKVHIFKYLNIEACSKPTPELSDLGKMSRPTSFTTCLTDVYSSKPYGCLDSGFNSVDSGSKRWSGNEVCVRGLLLLLLLLLVGREDYRAWPPLTPSDLHESIANFFFTHWRTPPLPLCIVTSAGGGFWGHN
ncbi:hypothetical protein AB205_0184690 [Aquarana catesbeiana]|uniref:Uncharacterized protein n=1 Tax=Aquarana catesbeiana TaxID=8400 RepID=A0A2G9QEG6_AQUCT|nr:hypothetical protein AB205_0184690 [Aquarana catesbeiana]